MTIRDRVMGFITAQFDITDWLHLSGRGNLDKIIDHQERKFSNGTVGVSGVGGAYNTTESTVTQKWFDANSGR